MWFENDDLPYNAADPGKITAAIEITGVNKEPWDITPPEGMCEPAKHNYDVIDKSVTRYETHIIVNTVAHCRNCGNILAQETSFRRAILSA